MSEYLILLRLSPGELIDTLGAIRNLSTTLISDVDIGYSMNIFGAWDVGIWINAENSGQALEFVQKKVKSLEGVIEVYTIPTFPHGNRNIASQETQNSDKQKKQLKNLTLK